MIVGEGERAICKQYFLSLTFRYDLLVHSDTGPEYSDGMLWPRATLDAFDASGVAVAIIDNRVMPADIARVASAIASNPGRLFVLTVVDPYFKQNEDGPYRQLLMDMAPAPNVVYLSKYQPVEFTARLKAQAGEGRFLVLPYPFVAAKVRATPDQLRSPRMIFAGATGATTYPEREALQVSLRRQPWLRLLVRRLDHPGYPEVGDRLEHDYIGTRFVDLLAGYRFMFVSGSRCELEFLKYRECAYAGCVPVGFAPATFNDRMRDCILPLDPANPWRQLRAHMRLPREELQQRAARFVALQLESRNPGLLNSELDAFLLPHLRRISAS